MRLRISSRQSDLARIQAYSVGQALQKIDSKLEISYQFRESLGDKNLTDPLWKMPEKGVFTEDFVNDLVEGKTDLVVHSWKDLPTLARGQTEIVATLPREDVRDLLLLKKGTGLNSKARLRIYSSSPRRAYNLAPFLKDHLPFNPAHIEFVSVRGNIPTRIKKTLFDPIDGLILAKAALDRILSAEKSEFSDLKTLIKNQLAEFHFMVLPISSNPTAAGQGALAIEISKTASSEIRSLLNKINCEKTFKSVIREREILASYGGGCHQKIGINIIKKEFGEIISLKGLTDSGEALNQWNLSSDIDTQGNVSLNKVFPADPKEKSFYERKQLKVNDPGGPLWIARSEGLPSEWIENLLQFHRLVWCAGTESWKKLAKLGVWVNGSSDGLGEDEDPQLEHLTKSPIKWTKLTHKEGFESESMRVLPTYELTFSESDQVLKEMLKGKTHFYWMSGSLFKKALDIAPEIANLNHACGPGNTSKIIKSILGRKGKLSIYLSHAQWLKRIVK